MIAYQSMINGWKRAAIAVRVFGAFMVGMAATICFLEPVAYAFEGLSVQSYDPDDKQISSLPSSRFYKERRRITATVTGVAGLNLYPNARMYEAGTIQAGIGVQDPYLHGYLGFQLAEPLYVSLRQTGEISSYKADPDRLYPGVDLKLRLLKERAYMPEMAVGLQSAFGHKRMAGEYLAFSKRYKDWDFTAGLGWGRYASAGQFKNPLKALHSHFGGERPLDGEKPNEPTHWFTGDDMGLFGGIEYFTPLDGLSIKLDYGSDRFVAEGQGFGYESPAPWSVGLNYKPYSWMDAGLAVQGTDKIMGRINISAFPGGWPYRPSYSSARYLRVPDLVPQVGENTPARMQAALPYRPFYSAPAQIRAASKQSMKTVSPDVQKLTFVPRYMGLRGRSVSLYRGPVQAAMTQNGGGSAEEIWRTTEFGEGAGSNFGRGKTGQPKSKKAQNFDLFKIPYLQFRIDNKISLSEEDSTLLYRSAAVAGYEGAGFMGLLYHGAALRLNMGDNLDRLAQLHPPGDDAVRGDVNDFAKRRLSLNHAHLSTMRSFTPEWHGLITAGYLEEMYGGAGGELLYRPFGKRYAIGAEGWYAAKRDPFSTLGAGLTGQGGFTGHINGWYDFPRQDITLHAKAGRYLGGDTGGTLALKKTFDNGASLQGFITMSDKEDADLFGGTTHFHHGIRLSLPLGSLRALPDGSHMDTELSPMGQNTGQILGRPLSLYDMTEMFSYDHLARNWHDMTE